MTGPLLTSPAAKTPGRVVSSTGGPRWFDMCPHRQGSNIKALPLLEPEVSGAVLAALTEQPLTAEEAERSVAMFKALGDPVRLRLSSAVASHQGDEACVCDISDVGVSQPTVSHHLKKLKEPGLRTSERRGTWVYYRVEPSVMAAMGACSRPGAEPPGRVRHREANRRVRRRAPAAVRRRPRLVRGIPSRGRSRVGAKGGRLAAGAP